MKSNLQRKQAFITDCSPGNEDFMQLYKIFTTTLQPGMSLRQFTLYYYSKRLQYIDATFMYDSEQLVGFCAAAFYLSDIDGKAVTIGRSAIGFLEAFQGKTLPKWMLYYKYIRYKNRYPFSSVILTIYVANPIVYSMICKYTAIVYPRCGVEIKSEVEAIKEKVLLSSGLTKRESAPFVVKINFDVQKGEKLLQRIRNSSDKHVQFFIKNTGLKPQMTMLVIIPISWKNIILTSFRFVGRAIGKQGIALPAIVKRVNKESIQKLSMVADAAVCNIWKGGAKGLVFFKKTGNHIALNCRNAVNLAVQYFNKANNQTANDNRKRVRTLFTKS